MTKSLTVIAPSYMYSVGWFTGENLMVNVGFLIYESLHRKTVTLALGNKMSVVLLLSPCMELSILFSTSLFSLLYRISGSLPQ